MQEGKSGKLYEIFKCINKEREKSCWVEWGEFVCNYVLNFSFLWPKYLFEKVSYLYSFLFTFHLPR